MREVARILIGSQNYYLDGPESDYDYKLLMMPTFDDFYTYHKVDKYDLPKKYDPEHYNVMSVLKYDENLRKGNINTLEMVFSRETEINSCLEPYFELARCAFEQGYLFSVWDTFIATVEGMVKNSLSRYGVNRKSVSRTLYLIYLCHYIAEHNFELNAAIWHEEKVYKRPRELRYNEAIELPTKETIFHMTDTMKVLTDNCRAYHRLMYSSSELDLIASYNTKLYTCMQNIIKNELRNELL